MKTHPMLFLTKIMLLTICGLFISTNIWASPEQLTAEQDQAMAKQLNDSKQRELNRLRSSGENRLRYGVKLTRMPTAIGNPSYTGNFTRFSDSAVITFWREAVDGSQRLFVHVQPTTASFFFCPGGSQFSIIQNGTDFGKAFRATRGNNDSICGDLKSPEIFLVDQWELYKSFDESQAFTIFYADRSSDFSGSISVAAAGAAVVVTPPTSTTVTGDCVADYSATGELHVPCVRVPGAFGRIETYDVWLKQKAGSFTFDLDTNRIQSK
jgi:hypothetical protein